MKRHLGLQHSFLCLLLAVILAPASLAQSAQSIAFAGLRAMAGKGQFNSIQVNSAGDIYLLLNQGDGVRLLKTDASASQLYAQAQLGSSGDIGIASATCPITVTFTPQASSSQALTPVISALSISSDAGTPLSYVSLYGTAVPSTLVLSPVALDFGSILVGSSATLPVQITNGSPDAATFNGILLSGDYAVTGSTCPATGSQLSPASSCTLQLTFTPTQAGARSGALSIATSLTQSPLTVTLSGSGAQSHLQTTPASLNFSSITVGSSARLTLSLANTGTAPVSSLSLATTGDYAITTPCATTVLASGASCAIGITFTPTAIGSRTGSLLVTSTDASSPLAVPLTGTGLAAGSFTLTVSGAGTASATVPSGQPATYPLTITALNGYTGGIVLNCTPINPGQYASCSLLPSSVTLGASPVASAVTLNTVTSVAASGNRRPGSTAILAFCILPVGLFFSGRKRATFLAALLAAFALSASGCGSGGTVNLGDPNLRYTPPGTYQYQVTATSTSGAQLSQTITLNLTVTPR